MIEKAKQSFPKQAMVAMGWSCCLILIFGRLFWASGCGTFCSGAAPNLQSDERERNLM